MDNVSNLPLDNQQQNKKKVGLNLELILGGIGTGLVILFFVFIILKYFHIISFSEIFYPLSTISPPNYSSINKNNSSVSQTEHNTISEKIIEKVGKENIYQKYLDTEMLSFAVQKSDDTQKILLKKIAKDSIILQAGQKEGLIELDSSIFNSTVIDYQKRIKKVEQVKKLIIERQNSVSGSVISIWFYNMEPGIIGYEKGKEIALDKITALHKDVLTKKITIKQAAQIIQKDTGLAQVDAAYQSNALFDFNAGPDERISFDPSFDVLIRKLEPGQLSSINLAKSKDINGKMIDAVYMFAQVNDRKDGGHPESFDEWYSQNEKSYEITFY